MSTLSRPSAVSLPFIVVVSLFFVAPLQSLAQPGEIPGGGPPMSGVEKPKKQNQDQKKSVEELLKRLKTIEENQKSILKTMKEEQEAALETIKKNHAAILKQLADLKKQLEKKKPTDPPQPVTILPAAVVQSNPPSVFLQGKVTNPSPTSTSGQTITQVQLGFGTEDGLALGQTLHVYRMNGEAKSLGRIQITNVSTKTATAQQIPDGNGKYAPALQAGDRFVSRLTIP